MYRLSVRSISRARGTWHVGTALSRSLSELYFNKLPKEQQQIPKRLSSIREPRDKTSIQNNTDRRSVQHIDKDNAVSDTKAKRCAEEYTRGLHAHLWDSDETWLRFSRLSRDSHRFMRDIDFNRTLALLRGSEKSARNGGAGAPTVQTMTRMLAVYGAVSDAGCTPDRYTYQEMIAINVALMDFKHAREWMSRMLLRGIRPSIRPYRTLLKGYSKVPSEIENARQLWLEIKQRVADGQIVAGKSKTELANAIDIKTYTCIVAAECKVGNFARTLELLDEMSQSGIEPDLAMRNVILDGVVDHNGLDAGLEEVKLMKESGMTPDGYTFSILLAAALKEDRLDELKRLLAISASQGFMPSIKLVRSLPFDPIETVDILAKRGSFDTSRVYNTLIRAAMQNNEFKQVLQLIDHMRKQSVQPNVVTYGMLLDTLNKAGRLDQAKAVFAELMSKHKLKPDTHIFSIMVDACGRAGDIKSMFEYKSMMAEHGMPPGEYIYNSVLSALARQPNVDLEALESMVDELVSAKPSVRPTIRTFNSIFAAFASYARNNELTEAQLRFLRTWYYNSSDRYYVVKDTYSYALVLEAFTAAKQLKDALDVYGDMVKQAENDAAVLRTFTGAPGHLVGLLQLCIKQQRFEDVLRLWRDWRTYSSYVPEPAVRNVLFACDQMGHTGVARDVVHSLLTPSMPTFSPQSIGEGTLALYIGHLVKHEMFADIAPVLELWRTAALPSPSPSLTDADAESLASAPRLPESSKSACAERSLSEDTVHSIIKLLLQSSHEDAGKTTDEVLAFVGQHFPDALPT
ncbi:hypothetical protein GGI15_003567 [Coemansia interrupta]|uniref:Pentatricopeptide repeat-containing protein n=1 Tax=Coemansia interrupta TaxID=1126814 RepID=A0A9W8HBW8_9FUNG|nr:hypothetical protein GGI15_003567 [Coemansia interrupta]